MHIIVPDDKLLTSQSFNTERMLDWLVSQFDKGLWQ